MNVVMIFIYGKRFRFAPSFNELSPICKTPTYELDLHLWKFVNSEGTQIFNFNAISRVWKVAILKNAKMSIFNQFLHETWKLIWSAMKVSYSVHLPNLRFTPLKVTILDFLTRMWAHHIKKSSHVNIQNIWTNCTKKAVDRWISISI